MDQMAVLENTIKRQKLDKVTKLGITDNKKNKMRCKTKSNSLYKNETTTVCRFD